MVRRSMFLPALVAVSGLLTGAWVVPASAGAATSPAAASSAKPADDDSPLELTIDSLTPSSLPERGPIRVTGRVTNRDEVPWTGISIYGVLGEQPLTSVDLLAEAEESDPEAAIGERVTDEGNYATVADLEPGQSATFSFSIARDFLAPTATGVYQFGVQALGESSTTPNDLVSDGRARTFLPYLPQGTPGTVKTSLVLPVRHVLDYLPDGSLDDLKHWGRTLSSGGRMRDLVDFAAAAGGAPLTWLVDPALPDAIGRLSAGNPPRSLAPTDPPEEPAAGGDEGEEGEESPSSDPSPTTEPSAPPTEEREPTEEERATAAAAASWLEAFRQALPGNEVLTLPYGDLDVAAAAEIDPRFYERARARPGRVLTEWGVTTRPAVSSPSGYLNAAGFELITNETTVLANDQMFGDDPPGVAEVDGKEVAVLSSGAATGGPSPGDQLTSVQLRQRILSEAAVRLLTPGRPPLVVSLPLDWHPADPTSFFAGLTVGWLELTTLADATDREGRDVEADGLDYPATQQRRQLDPPAFAAASALVEEGVTLQNVLTLNSRVSESVADEALAGLSYGSREAPADARMRLDGSREWITKQLEKVSIAAGPGVTLSGSDGSFATVISNDLDQPVEVNVLARSNGGVEISSVDTVELGPKSRTTVVLEAHANRVGVTNVTLVLSDVDGNLLGSTDQLPIRSAQVSVVIWVIIGAGVALLFLAILVRLVRRIRNASREPAVAAPDDTAPDETPDPTPAPTTGSTP